MTKAKRVLGTPRTNSPSKILPAPLSHPDQYCLRLAGDCMEPAIPDGAAVAVDKLAKIHAGDLVVVWLRPEFVAPGQHPAMVKILGLAIPPWVKAFPYEDHPKSDVAAIALLEQTKPARQYVVRCNQILAIHKATHYAPVAPAIGGKLSSADMLPILTLMR